MICPSPDVRYQMYLEYLSGLCLFMRNKYNEEYVWGDKKLSDGKRGKCNEELKTIYGSLSGGIPDADRSVMQQHDSTGGRYG